MPRQLREFNEIVDKSTKAMLEPADILLEIISIMGMYAFIAKSADAVDLIEQIKPYYEKAIDICLAMCPLSEVVRRDFLTIYNDEALDNYFQKFEIYERAREHYELYNKLPTTEITLEDLILLVVSLVRTFLDPQKVLSAVINAIPLCKIIYDFIADRMKQVTITSPFELIDFYYNQFDWDTITKGKIAINDILASFNPLYYLYRNIAFVAIKLIDSYETATEEIKLKLQPRKYLKFGRLTIKATQEDENETYENTLYLGDALTNIYNFKIPKLTDSLPQIELNHEGYVFSTIPKWQKYKIKDIRYLYTIEDRMTGGSWSFDADYKLMSTSPSVGGTKLYVVDTDTFTVVKEISEIWPYRIFNHKISEKGNLLAYVYFYSNNPIGIKILNMLTNTTLDYKLYNLTESSNIVFINNDKRAVANYLHHKFYVLNTERFEPPKVIHTKEQLEIDNMKPAIALMHKSVTHDSRVTIYLFYAISQTDVILKVTDLDVDKGKLYDILELTTKYFSPRWAFWKEKGLTFLRTYYPDRFIKFNLKKRTYEDLEPLNFSRQIYITNKDAIVATAINKTIYLYNLATNEVLISKFLPDYPTTYSLFEITKPNFISLLPRFDERHFYKLVY